MKKRLFLIAVPAVLILAVIVAIVVARQRVRRHRVFRLAPAAKQPVAVAATRPEPMERWSDQFRALEISGNWRALNEVLDAIEKEHPTEYARWNLGYLHARSLLENGDEEGAEKKLAPFLAAGNPFRDVALFHEAEIEDARDQHDAASRTRTDLILGMPQSFYREQAIEDEIEHRSALANPKPLIDMAARLYPTADTKRRRDLDGRVVESLMRAGDANGALTKGLALLRGGTMDDAADRVSRTIDKPELLKRMNAEQLLTLGDALRNHRRFDRAVAVLSMALPALPAKHDDILFSIGRSYYGDEKLVEARATYLRGARETRELNQKVTFLWHAARAAQLLGDDQGAELLMTQAIRLPVRNDATAAAITQRMRTRLKQRRGAEASADLQLVRTMFPKDHAVVDASLAYAIAMLGAGNAPVALATLNAVPRNLVTKLDAPELEYWRGRAVEGKDPHAALVAYLNVLGNNAPTHFAYFAKQRLATPPLVPHVAREVAVRDAQIANLLASKQFDLARRIATDRVLLRPDAAGLKQLAEIYKQVPAYRAVLELTPFNTPKFPLQQSDRASQLMAMGFFDETTDEIQKRWPLRPPRAALTQAWTLNRAAASRESIYAIEVMMNSVPADYEPQLLPHLVGELLYPRYFYDAITEDATKFEADPTLVLAIMREESRFDPRAKSEAAARGLLQFIITTAAEIGREIGIVEIEPDDLYDPRVIIRLGAKYIAALTKQFGGNRYQAAAAYNAGPKQVALWSRMLPGPGDDYFLSSINFDETKQYVRKVMNSYRAYEDVYR